MCSICRVILQDYSVDHDEGMCPLRNSRYCSYCAKTGHLTKKCPAKPKFCEPTYMEQLIPPSELKAFNITSKTPIKYKLEEPQEFIEILNNDKVIVAYLVARSIKFTPKDKRLKLEEYAALNNKRLIYIE